MEAAEIDSADYARDDDAAVKRGVSTRREGLGKMMNERRCLQVAQSKYDDEPNLLPL